MNYPKSLWICPLCPGCAPLRPPRRSNMTLRSWIRKLFARPAARPIRKAPARCRPRVEALEDRLTPAVPVAPGHELVVLDAAVADRAALLGGVAPGTEVAVLDADRDGVQQLAELLAGRSGLDAIHLVSHGSQGALRLGNATLSDGNLGAYAAELDVLESALAPGGDLLLYGCDVAAGAAGEAFVTDVARITGADVAASTNLTGSASLGGDWELEWHAGPVEAAVPFNEAARAEFGGTLDIVFDITAVAGQSTGLTQPDPLANGYKVNLAPT